MHLDRTIVLPLVLIVVIFAALGFVQITFQNDMHQTLQQSQVNFRQVTETLNQSEANFDTMIQTQLIMNQTLDTLSHSSPQSNFTAQATAIKNIEYIIDAVDDIKRMLNAT